MSIRKCEITNARLLLLHGINLNALGRRDSSHYGNVTLADIETISMNEAKKNGFEMISYQSNHEGCLVDKIQSESLNCSGIIINPGALTHYSYGLHDALLDSGLPVIEVHLSDIDQREPWRKLSVISPVCFKVIKGKKEKGYIEAVRSLVEHIKNENHK